MFRLTAKINAQAQTGICILYRSKSAATRKMNELKKKGWEFFEVEEV